MMTLRSLNMLDKAEHACAPGDRRAHMRDDANRHDARVRQNGSSASDESRDDEPAVHASRESRRTLHAYDATLVVIR